MILRRVFLSLLLGLGVWLGAATPVLAHKASDSYLTLQVQGQQVQGQWDIALRDMDFALALDADGDGEIRWGELRTRQADIAAWALGALALQRGGRCALQVTQLQVDDHSDGAYAVLHLAGSCPLASGELGVHYRLLFAQDALHRGLLRVGVDGVSHSAVMGPETAQQRFSPQAPSPLAQWGQFWVEGVWHIWIGFDHILFLVSLLLPVVLVRRAGQWQGVERLGQALREVLWVVTSFTLAHSITLSLAALGVVSLPSRWVESAIALSVVLAALNNLWPLVQGRRWLIAFIFGLIHGFGFASVLADLGLPQEGLVLSLVGFNVGVEAGQLAIVAAFLPVAYALRHTALYRRGVFVGGSVLTVAIALVWLTERALDLK